MAVSLSPSVQTNEVDFSTYVSNISSTVVGAVGGATKGEENKLYFLSSPEDFIQKLGEPTTDSLSTYSVLQYLQEGNQLYYVRVGDDNIIEATITLEDTSATPVPLVTVHAVSPGTWGEDISISTTDIDGFEFSLEVFYEGTLVEEYTNLSLDDTSDRYIEDVVTSDVSDYIYLVDEQAGSGTGIESATDRTLANADDGLSNLLASDIVGSTGTEEGLQIFKNQESVDINVLVVPGKSSLESVASEMLAICESRGDCIAVIDPPDQLSAQGVVDWHNGEGGGEDDPSSALSSSYGACYYPWLKIYDNYNSQNLWVPPSGFVVAQYAKSDRIANTWFAPAGMKRGNITRALDVRFSPNKGERDLMYGGGNAINPIVNFSQEGITIWGQRTLQRESSATDRVNVRRLLVMIRKAIAASTRYLIFDPNDEFLWNEWKGMVRPYLENLKKARAFYDYQIQMGLGTTMSNQDIDNNEVNGRVAVQPTKSGEFFNIDFVLRNTGAEFQ